MGLTRTKVVLANPKTPEIEALELDALADTGAVHMCIPAWVASRLQLESLEDRAVTLADGRRMSGPYVGPLEVRFANRRCYVGAMVLGDEALLGAIPMEDLDLVVHPQTRTVTVKPASPHIATTIIKGARGSCPVSPQP